MLDKYAGRRVARVLATRAGTLAYNAVRGRVAYVDPNSRRRLAAGQDDALRSGYPPFTMSQSSITRLLPAGRERA